MMNPLDPAVRSQLASAHEPQLPVRLPLSFQQQWLWDLLQRQPQWRCMVAYTFRLRGPLDVGVLNRSFAAIVARHESLRTRVVALDGSPSLETEPPQAYRLECVSIPGRDEAELEENGRRWVEELCGVRVDPLTGPLLVARLLELAAGEHYWLVLAMHRLIGDCASIDQVFRETWQLYEALARDRPPPFTKEAPQYGGYITRQQETAGDWSNRHAGYWKGRLAGAQPLHWPTDARTAATPRGTLGRMNVLFGDSASAGLRTLARNARTLTANVILALYVAVLWRWCGQNDFVVPFFTAGRQSEQKTVVGYFSHLLYLRMQLSGNETFPELLNHVSNELFRALSHQDFGRMATQHPELLAGVFFQWVTWHPDEVAGRPVSVAPYPPVLTAERVTLKDFGEDLTAIPPGTVAVEVTFFDTPGGIYASGVYRADLFAASTMERFMADLRSTAEHFIGHPDARVTTASQRE